MTNKPLSPEEIASKVYSQAIMVHKARYENGRFILTVYVGNRFETLTVPMEIVKLLAKVD